MYMETFVSIKSTREWVTDLKWRQAGNVTPGRANFTSTASWKSRLDSIRLDLIQKASSTGLLCSAVSALALCVCVYLNKQTKTCESMSCLRKALTVYSIIDCVFLIYIRFFLCECCEICTTFIWTYLIKYSSTKSMLFTLTANWVNDLLKSNRFLKISYVVSIEILCK